MKWLLVTTNPTPFAADSAHPHGAGWNVGDQFARVGTEQLVREVDPQAEIELLNMDVAASFIPERPFDRAIFAGRPMFWHKAEEHPLWVHLLDGWLCRDPRKVMALGVGECFPLAAETLELERQIHRVSQRLWRLVLRSRRHTPFFEALPAGVDVTVCPGAWAITHRDDEPHEKLCNFMSGGAHYPAFDPDEAAQWRSIAGFTAAVLRAEGFRFVAHTLQEADLAEALGWPAYEVRISSNVEGYLRIYSRARNYIGNRMHGAILLAGRHSVASAIGFDSRLLAVEHAGAYVTKPSGINPTALLALARLEPGLAEEQRVRRIRAERSRMLELLREFAS